MKLSIIIVTYNTKDVLKECIKSIFNSKTYFDFEVIIVDNASSDGTVEAISAFEKKHKNLKVIGNKENLGFSKANNIGVKKSEGEFVLFLNPDTLLSENVLEKMVDFMESEPKCGASTCKVLLTSGKIDDSCHRGFPTPWNSFTHFSGMSKLFPKSELFNGYNLGGLNLDEIHEIDALAGSFMLVRREAGVEVNWWDEDYFFYGEDLDFCYMLKKKDWKIFYFPFSTITHLKGVSGGLKKISEKITTASWKTRERASLARFDAMRIFYKKHYEKKYPWIVTRLVYLGISVKQAFS